MRLAALARWETVVLLSWAVMTVLAGEFVARYGQNYPRQDEWEFISVLYGLESRWDWVFARHYEHRYILARAIFLLLDAVSGHDFRAGMWVTVVLLSASALQLIRVARQLRGYSHPLDVMFPVLLLNAGHCENLLMGYQVAFTLTAYLLTLVLTVAAHAEQVGAFRSGLRAGLLLLPITLGGAVGVVFSPAISLWIAFLAWHVWRAEGFGRAVVVLACPVVAACYVGFTAYETFHTPVASPRNDTTATLWNALAFLTQGLGGVGRLGWPVLGILALLLQADVAVSLAVNVFRVRERAAALGWLSVLLSVWLLALVIGHVREAVTDFRYTTPSCLAFCVCGLATARYTRWRPRLGPGTGLILAVAALVAYNDWRFGREFAEVYKLRWEALKADVRAGVPVDLVAERNVLFPVPQYHQHFLLLHDRGFPILRDAAPRQHFKVIELPLSPDAAIPAWTPSDGPKPYLVFTLPNLRHVNAVRVHFSNTDSRYFESFQLFWHPSTEAPPRHSTVMPWLVPRDGVIAFWIDDHLSMFWLQVGLPSMGLKLTRVELLVDGE